jgi:hypothetical protein
MKNHPKLHGQHAQVSATDQGKAGIAGGRGSVIPSKTATPFKDSNSLMSGVQACQSRSRVAPPTLVRRASSSPVTK